MLLIDHARRTAQWQGVPVPLSGRSFELLVLLAEQPGELVAAERLVHALWPNRRVDPTNLRVHVAALRRHLGPQAVRTVVGRGYALNLTAAAPPALPPHAAQANGLPPAAALPQPQGELIGRDQAAVQLQAALSSQRWVQLLGPGGIGKTSLALHVAQALAPGLPGGVMWADLSLLAAGDDGPAPLVQALAAAAGLQASADGHRPTARQLGAALSRATAGARALLVLDNAEPVAAPLAALLPELLGAAPALRVLVTSRRVLPLTGGRVQWLEPLATPHAKAGEDALRDSPAVQLLLLRAQALHPQWAPSPADWPHLGALVRALDGLPLALELVAPRLPLLGAQPLLTQLTASLPHLANPQVTAPARQRTLQAALAWSLSLLPPREQAALGPLALFVAPFRPGTAVGLLQATGLEAAAAEHAVEQLVTHSLLQLLRPAAGGADGARGEAAGHAAPVRLRLLETTRVHALELLASLDGAAVAAGQRAYVDAMAALARAASHDFHTASDRAWTARWLPEHADLQRAFDLASAAGHADAAADLIETLVLGANITGNLDPALQRWEATRALAPQAGPLARAKLLGWGNLARGSAGGRLGQSAQRVQAWRQVAGPEGRRGLCVALAMHAGACQDSGDAAAADAALAECLDLEDPAWSPRLRRRCGWFALTRLAVARDDNHLLARAGRVSARLGAELLQLGAAREHTLVLGQQALMLRLRGRWAAAAGLLKQAHALQLQLGCELDAGRSLGLYAATLAEQIHFAPAGVPGTATAMGMGTDTETHTDIDTDDPAPATVTSLLQQACSAGHRALTLLAPYPALIVQFADGLAELLARCGEPELAAQLLAGAAQQRQAQQQGANRLVQAAAARAWHAVRQQLDAATLAGCTGQGQRFSAEALRQVALSGLAPAGSAAAGPSDVLTIAG